MRMCAKAGRRLTAVQERMGADEDTGNVKRLAFGG